MLHFSTNQIFWDCATKSACEAFPHGIPTQLDTAAGIDRDWRAMLLKASSSEPWEQSFSGDRFWEEAVRTYTSCKLTEHKDKLTAMWGVAKLVGDAEGERYGVGFWEGRHRLVYQLGWEVSQLVEEDAQKDWPSGTRRPPAGDTATDPEDGRGLEFPTWSWASIADGTIKVADRWFDEEEASFYHARKHNGDKLVLSIAESSSSELGTSAEPQMTTKILDIHGLFGSCVPRATARGAKYAMELRIPSESSGKFEEKVVTPDTDRLWVVPDTLDVVDSENVGHYNFILLTASYGVEVEYDNGQMVHRLPRQEDPIVYSGFGLILKRRTGGKDCEYQRVGLFRLQGLKSDWWAALCHACGLKFDERKDTKLDHLSGNEGTKIELW